MNYLKPTLLLLLLTCFTMIACDPDENGDDDKSVIEKGVFVVNEGGFQIGNGSVSHIDPTTKTVSNDLFSTTNSRALGDIAQSMAWFEDQVLIVVNNSNKIELVNAATFESEGTIGNIPSPRYVQVVNENEAWVSSLGNAYLRKVNLTSLTVTDSVEIAATANPFFIWMERLLENDGELWAANMKEGVILVLNANTGETLDKVAVTLDPNSMVMDNDGHLWVLSGGGVCPYDMCQTPTLQKINMATRTVEQTFEFPDATASPNSLAIDTDAGQLYFIAYSSVYQMDVSATAIPDNAAITSTDRTFYRLAYDNGNDKLYVTDAADFSQAGWLLQYDASTLSLEETFEVGVIPSGVYFR